MLAVAIAAIDLTAIRAYLGPSSPFGDELLLGALPMANVLAGGILFGQRRPGSNPFLLGFEIFGALALASYVVLTISFPGPGGPIYSYVSTVLEPVVALIGHDNPIVFIPIVCLVAVVMLLWPQVAIALIGGVVARWFRGSEPREHRDHVEPVDPGHHSAHWNRVKPIDSGSP
jgi:hypothetical protein